MASTIAHFFDRYRRAFEEYDLDGLAALIHVPCIVMGHDVDAVTDATQLRARLEHQFERHREAGLAHARFDVLAHRRLEPQYVTADVVWDLQREDGSTIWKFALVYTLTAPETGWKIACVTPLEHVHDDDVSLADDAPGATPEAPET